MEKLKRPKLHGQLRRSGGSPLVFWPFIFFYFLFSLKGLSINITYYGSKNMPNFAITESSIMGKNSGAKFLENNIFPHGY